MASILNDSTERIESIARRVAFDIMFGFAIEMINSVIYQSESQRTSFSLVINIASRVSGRLASVYLRER